MRQPGSGRKPGGADGATRSDAIKLRVSPAEKRFIERLADRAGLPLSEFARLRLMAPLSEAEQAYASSKKALSRIVRAARTR